MNGIHDMGGMHGFGRVEVEPDEPVFHSRWEARVFGIVQALPGGNIDAGRHSLERLGPEAYLRNGYYGRWFASLERTLVDLGVVSREDVEKRISSLGRRTKASRGAKAPKAGASKKKVPPAGKPFVPLVTSYVRTVDRPPRFASGDAVRTRNHQPAGHTRLPAYVRCRRGTIEHVHPAMVYPDDHANESGENPQYLYTVRFDGRELWGDDAEPGTVVHVDLFEPYLEAI